MSYQAKNKENSGGITPKTEEQRKLDHTNIKVWEICVNKKELQSMCVSHVSYQANNKGDSRQALHKTNRKVCYTVLLDHTDLEIL